MFADSVVKDMLLKKRIIGDSSSDVSSMGVVIRRFDGQQDEPRTDDVVL